MDCVPLCFWMVFRKDRNYYGNVRFKIRNIHVSAVGILDPKKNMISELKDFDIHENELIIDTSNDGLRVHLSGDLCWFGKCLFADRLNPSERNKLLLNIFFVTYFF